MKFKFSTDLERFREKLSDYEIHIFHICNQYFLHNVKNTIKCCKIKVGRLNLAHMCTKGLEIFLNNFFVHINYISYIM